MNKILDELKKSKFRSSFKLKDKDISYIEKNGLENIKIHAYKFVNERLKDKYIKNDGKQTPYKGHPVFIAMHSTACCCRKCLYKWHKIEPNKELSEKEIDCIVSIIMEWIIGEYNGSTSNKL